MAVCSRRGPGTCVNQLDRGPPFLKRIGAPRPLWGLERAARANNANAVLCLASIAAPCPFAAAILGAQCAGPTIPPLEKDRPTAALSPFSELTVQELAAGEWHCGRWEEGSRKYRKEKRKSQRQ